MFAALCLAVARVPGRPRAVPRRMHAMSVRLTEGFPLEETPEQRFALKALRQLREAGYEALWAGGCVRDLLLGGMPEDYDIATSATPAQVREVFGYRRTLPVGIAFGVVLVKAPKSGQVEVATFRTDASYSDGRHPDAVTFSTAIEDAQRRDFTINGMFYDPLERHLIDYVGGIDDLRAGCIRAIGSPSARFAEDKLRMLRAVRFAARLGFDIEATTRAAIQQHASEITAVAGERLLVELRKTLESERAAWALQQWHELQILPELLPRTRDSAEQIEAAIQLMQHVAALDWRTRLSVLLWSLTHSDRQRTADVIAAWKGWLKLPNEDSHALMFSVEAQAILERAEELAWSQMQPVLAHRYAQTAVELFAARAQLENRWHSKLEWLRERHSWPLERLSPPPLLSGGDLIDVGLTPGPRFRELLEAAWQRQLDGHFEDRAAALEWLREQLD